MIDQATIDRIMDAAQIVDVVSEFVTLRKRGVNYIGLCPFHNEKTPSFSVSPSKGVCKCFSCGKGGNVVHFIMEHEQLSYYEALKWLAKKYNIEIKERELTDEEKQAHSLRESLFVVNQFASEYFQNILYNNIDGQRIGMTYLRGRGFRDDIIKKFQLGYSTDNHDALARAALQKGYKEEFLVKTGLCYRKEDGTLRDRFWGRVIFPVHTISGKVVAFGGRVLSAATKNVQMQSGIENVVASSGTALTSEQIRLIHRFTNNITVLYDGDGAGIKASIRGIDMLLEEGMNVKVCLLPDGDDPDSFARKHNATDYQAYINDHEVDFIRFKTDLLMEEAGKDPIKRASLISSIVKSISVIPDAIVRSVYIRECSQLLQMEEKVLIEATAKLIEQAREAKFKEQQRKKEREQRLTATPQASVPESSPEAQTNETPAADSTSETGNAPFPSEPAPFPTEPYTSYIPSEGNEQKVFYAKEEDLVRMLIRYGEKVMCYVENETGEQIPFTVTECIASGLKEDELQFYDPLHRLVLQECEAHLNDPNFNPERYFIAHPDPAVSKLAVDLVSDRYQLSKYHSKGQKIVSDEERLYELVPRLLLDFKLSIVEEEMKHTIQALANPEIANDPQRCLEIMKRYKELQETQSVMAQHAGDRVVLKL